MTEGVSSSTSPSTHRPTRRFAVLTSGGDSPGMNAAVRAVVRAGINQGAAMSVVHEGYQGMVDGGASIRPVRWEDVGGILHLGGTVIGSARCKAFREREGRLRAAENLVTSGIEGLVVIGGDGSLTGANLFREEWPGLLAELESAGRIPPQSAEAFPNLRVVGLVGSIDNDMFGTDMTIGADTALHRIVDAVDMITATAASHHRTFVIEVMGRNCGYLALMSGLATGANWVLIPECPPPMSDWEGEMIRVLHASQEAGRRHGIVIVAEGARDREGNPLTAHYVKEVLEKSGNDSRITILGHVQRGGAPSAFDRNLSTILGYEAIRTLVHGDPLEPPKLLGLRENRVTAMPLMQAVHQTWEVAAAIERKDYDTAMRLRGGSFSDAFANLRTLQLAQPHETTDLSASRRLLVLHAGGPSPGMNTIVRAATRLALEDGHTVLASRHGFRGVMAGDLFELDWMSVHGWVGKGGAELGTSRRVPAVEELGAVARVLREHQVDMMLIVGGWAGYHAASRMSEFREAHPAFDIPICCIPASINNGLPGSEYSIGADTALNSIVDNVDKIKRSAVASHRCFIVEVMGRNCGYLGAMAAMATGAERVYLPEEGIGLDDLRADVDRLVAEFSAGKRLGLFIRSEKADASYTTDFIARLFEKEGRGLYDVRQSILGHTQQGGNPSPYDRIQGTRLAAHALHWLEEQVVSDSPQQAAICLQGGKVTFSSFEELFRLRHPEFERPLEQKWLELKVVLEAMSDRNLRLDAAPSGASELEPGTIPGVG